MKKTGVPFQPAKDKYLVKVEEALSISDGGVYIPDQAKEKPMEGKIIRRGFDPVSDYEIGDHILFGKYSGVEIRIDNEDYLLLNIDDILGKRI